MTSYVFTPIPDELADVLEEAVQDMNGDGEYCFYMTESEREISELERLGYLDRVQMFISGDCLVRVTSKGVRYRRELAKWQEERRRRAEDEKARDRKTASRQWAIAAIGAAVTLISGLIGYMFGSMR